MENKRSELDLRQGTLRLATKKLKEKKRVLISAATGFGKSKLALELCELSNYDFIYILVPTDKVGEAWDDEIKKWDFPIKYETINYKSVHKVFPEFYKYPAIIMDECHAVTDLRMVSLINFKCDMIALSATVDSEKMTMLKKLGFDDDLRVTLDQAQEHGLVAPYTITVILFSVNNTDKNIPAGNKDNRFFVSEKEALAYTEKRIGLAKKSGNRKSIEFAYLSRTRLIRTLPSRIVIAKKIISRLNERKDGLKTLVFAPDIKTCEDITPNCFYHSKSGDDGFDSFNNGSQDMLGSVSALSEGINVKADRAIILAGLSKERHMIQKLGRILRKTREGKEGSMILLVAEHTKDEDWCKASLAGLSNIKYFHAKNLKL